MKYLETNSMLLAVIIALSVTFGPSALGDEKTNAALETRVGALERMISGSGEKSLHRFAEKNTSPSLRASLAPDILLKRLKRIRSVCAQAGYVTLEPIGTDGLRMTCGNDNAAHAIDFTLESASPHAMASLTIAKTEGKQHSVTVKPITWNNLDSRMKEEATEGFEGTVLVVRNGEIALHQSYGQADHERNVPNSRSTLFAIGSMPIDFTRAAILKLVDLGTVKTSDRITEFFADVPADKQSMTLNHLMSGRSGLPNYHHIPGTDADYDLTWIDRSTAVKRMLGKDLLFAPGKGQAHSHSAWTLLAAVVEMASQKSYSDFLTEHFFRKAGMQRTGLYEHTSTFSDDELATGYGHSTVGRINSPKYWGKTSWLVMGSGGMVSTPGDLYKWTEALRTGKFLSKKSLALYGPPGAKAGDCDRGFLCFSVDEYKNMMFLCSNAYDPMRGHAESVAKALAKLVSAG